MKTLKENTASLAIAIISLPLLFVISGRSLWIDEFTTASLASQPSPVSALKYAKSLGTSEALMPAWVVITNISGVLFGTSEISLRAVNVLWLVLAILALFKIGVRSVNAGPALFFAVLPFTWYYGHEARPYALQLFLGAFWVFAAWRYFSGRSGREIWILVLATTVLVWTSLTTAIIGISMAALFLCLVNRGSYSRLRKELPALITGSVVNTPVLLFYAYAVFFMGASSAKLWNVGVANLAFSAYEVLGFVGLGPGRLDLREASSLGGMDGAAQVLSAYLIPLVILGISWVLVAVSGTMHIVKTLKPDDRYGRFIQLMISCPVFAVGTLFVASVFAEFPVWGRHFAPVVPLIAASVGLLFQSALIERRSSPAKMVLISGSILFVLLVGSTAQVRLSERHYTEDYRGAAEIAQLAHAEGLHVSWLAAERGAIYYLPQETLAEISVGHIPVLCDSQVTLIIRSKPDIYDRERRVEKLLSSRPSDVTVCDTVVRGFEVIVVGVKGDAVLQQINMNKSLSE